MPDQLPWITLRINRNPGGNVYSLHRGGRQIAQYTDLDQAVQKADDCLKAQLQDLPRHLATGPVDLVRTSPLTLGEQP